MASEGEITAWTGVRKMLDAYAEREVQKIRWSAVMAGLFLSLGSEILLGSLGIAAGITASAPDAPGMLSRFSSAAGIFSTFVALLSTFIGGYAAAKLGGAIRRSDGVLSGTLTWATSLVLALWMVLPSLSAVALSGLDGRTLSNLQRGVKTTAEQRAASDDVAKSAWFVFTAASLSLLTAMAGGAAGSVGMAGAHSNIAARRRQIQRLKEQSQAGQELK